MTLMARKPEWKVDKYKNLLPKYMQIHIYIYINPDYTIQRQYRDMRSPTPTPLLFRRHSSSDIRNLASISSSLLPAFGTVVGEGTPILKTLVIAPYDRRYRYIIYTYIPHLFNFINTHTTHPIKHVCFVQVMKLFLNFKENCLICVCSSEFLVCLFSLSAFDAIANFA